MRPHQLTTQELCQSQAMDISLKFSLGGADPHRLNPWPKFRLRQEFGCSRPTADRMKATMPPWLCPALHPQQCLAQSSTSNQRQPPAATAFLGPFSPILVHISKTCSVYCPSSDGLSFPMVIQQWLKPWENQLKRGNPTSKISPS